MVVKNSLNIAQIINLYWCTETLIYSSLLWSSNYSIMKILLFAGFAGGLFVFWGFLGFLEVFLPCSPPRGSPSMLSSAPPELLPCKQFGSINVWVKADDSASRAKFYTEPIPQAQQVMAGWKDFLHCFYERKDDYIGKRDFHIFSTQEVITFWGRLMDCKAPLCDDLVISISWIYVYPLVSSFSTRRQTAPTMQEAWKCLMLLCLPCKKWGRMKDVNAHPCRLSPGLGSRTRLFATLSLSVVWVAFSFF